MCVCVYMHVHTCVSKSMEMNRSLLILTVNKFMSNVTNETNASKQSFPKEFKKKKKTTFHTNRKDQGRRGKPDDQGLLRNKQKCATAATRLRAQSGGFVHSPLASYLKTLKGAM